MNRPNKSDALSKLADLIAKVEELSNLRHDSPEFSKWKRATELALRNIFGEKAKNVDEFSSLSYSPMIISMGGGDGQFQRPYLSGLQSAKALLESMVEEIDEYWRDESAQASSPEVTHAPQLAGTSKNVFVVHGRDDGTKETIARFVSNLGYVPVILHEQPSGGKTVIEKFEKNADACFAIALLTPDDMGGLSGDTDLKPRARQNVIFEFGYFIGRLSRLRVCAITKGEVELPSDYAGVVYIPLDSAGAWRLLLLREMKAAGLSVDANKVL